MRGFGKTCKGMILNRFYYMEYHDLLESTNEIRLFALHFIYLTRIIFALQQFAEGWNSHGIKTEHGLSPNQLFTAGVLQLLSVKFNHIRIMIIMELMKMTLMKLKITMKECQFHILQWQLSDEQFRELQLLVNSHANDDNYGINLYQQVSEYLYDQSIYKQQHKM